MVKVISTNDISLQELSDVKNMGGEVIAARGSFESLVGRFDDVRSKLSTNTNNISTNTTQIGNISNFRPQDTSVSISDKVKNEFSDRAFNLLWYSGSKVAVSGGYDWQPAITAACSAITANGGKGVLLLPPQQIDIATTYTVPSGVHIVGSGIFASVINAISDTPNLKFTDNTSCINVKFVNTFSTIRGSSNSNNPIWVNGKNIVIDRVYISGSKGAGIYVGQSEDVWITNSIVENTLADGIHITDGSKNIYVQGNITKETGDDAYAVVSYQSQINMCDNIHIVDNYSYHSKSRGAVVVGGKNVTIARNRFVAPTNAGVYIAYESSYNTFGVDNIEILDNRIRDANSYNQTSNYGAIHISSSSLTYPITNVRVMRNKMFNSRWRGISIGNAGTTDATIQEIVIMDNEINGNTLGEGIVWSNCKNIVLRRNKVKDVNSYGMYDGVSNAGYMVVDDNIIDNANTSATVGADGITIRTTTTMDFIEVSRNRVIDNNSRLERRIEVNSSITRLIYKDNIFIGTNKNDFLPDMTLQIPVHVGQTWIKSGVAYMATGTTATTDWKALN